LDQIPKASPQMPTASKSRLCLKIISHFLHILKILHMKGKISI